MRALTEAETKHHVAEIAERGYSIVEDAFDADFARRLMEEFEHLDRIRPGGDIPPAPFVGFVTRRWFDVLNDGDIWQQVAVQATIMNVLPHVLGEGFLLSTMGTAIIGPGEKAQPLHVDDGVYAFPRPHPNLVCNTMWAVTDFTEANGATRVVPGSNNFDDDPEFGKSYDSVPVEMKAGSIAFVSGTCFHGAGENQSNEERYGLTIYYCNGSMRQQENLMLAIHPSRMLEFSRELQDILGFQMCKGAGHLFAGDPRSEMERHYGPADSDQAWLDRRGEKVIRSMADTATDA